MGQLAVLEGLVSEIISYTELQERIVSFDH